MATSAQGHFSLRVPEERSENLDDDELMALRKAADVFTKLDDATIRRALNDGKWKEIHCDEKNLQN